MHAPNLKQGLKIQVEILSASSKQRYLSCIESIGPDSILITLPHTTDNHELGIQVGMECRVTFRTSVGTCGFDTQILEILPGSPLLMHLSPPNTFHGWTRQHLRSDVRSLWVRYTVVPRPEMRGRIDRTFRSYVQTLNISGGGFFIPFTEKLSLGTILELEIDIPTEIEPVLAIGQVAHSSKSGQGVEFLLIDDTDQDRIIRYIFAEERLSRRQDESEQVS